MDQISSRSFHKTTQSSKQGKWETSRGLVQPWEAIDRVEIKGIRAGFGWRRIGLSFVSERIREERVSGAAVVGK